MPSEMKIMFVVKLFLTAIVAYALAYPFVHPTTNAGVFQELSLLGPIGSGVVVVLFLLAVFLYCRDLSRSLQLVKPENRTATPKSVWLMFVIPYNFIEDFFIIIHVADSLAREAKSNPALQKFSRFGKVSGLTWCSAQIVSLLPHEVGSLAGFIALPFWVVHWRLIRTINTSLAQTSNNH